MTILRLIAPALIGAIFIALASLLNEPARKKFMVVMLAGASAAYLSGFGMRF